MTNAIEKNVKYILENVGKKSRIVIKEILIGKDKPIEASIIYINGLVDINIIDRDILNPLMLGINTDLELSSKLSDYLCKKYILNSDTKVISNIDETVSLIKEGNTAILIDKLNTYIVVNTVGGKHREISDSVSEFAIRESRESFVENIDTNISIMTRRIKEKNLVIEKSKVGRRSQTDLAIIYIDDIVNTNALEQIRDRINKIDVDFVTGIGMVEQYIEEYTYTVFPQMYFTERPDIVEANLMEGRIALMLDGTPNVVTVPALFNDFIQGIEDYYQRTLVANFTRFVRFVAILIVITLPSIYLTLIKFNVELIPIKFIVPISKSRVNIALPPFLEILSMELTAELLREGGMRLPSKIAQTLSIIGGIIIGDTAIQAKIVSPPTLLIVGITIVATFVIPNYDMTLSVRLLRFPMLILANFMGIFGIAVGWFIIVVHLCNMNSFGVPYFSLNKSDMKDIVFRAPLWKMKTRPKDIAQGDIIRKSDFREKFKRNKNE